MRFIILTLLAQSVGLVCGIAARAIIPGPIPLLILSVHSLAALAVAWKLHLPRSFQILNLLLPAAVLFILENQLPSELLLVISALLLLIYLPTVWTRVPYYPTSRLMYEEIAKLLPSDREFSFVDLGCGFAPLLGFLAQRFPKAKFYGVEVSVLPYLISKLRSFLYPGRLKIQFKSIWNTDLNRFDYVYAFLAPPPMARLWQKAKSEMKPGSFFLTNTFRVPDAPDKKIAVNDQRKCVLYLHKI